MGRPVELVDRKMKVWLDDLREPPGEDWVHVRTVTEAQIVLRSKKVEDLSLDHDLGNQPDGDAIKLVLWMAEEDVWPKNRPTIHSRNPVGRENMNAVIERYGPY